jgi:hypothetical protein
MESLREKFKRWDKQHGIMYSVKFILVCSLIFFLIWLLFGRPQIGYPPHPPCHYIDGDLAHCIPD